MSAADGHGMDGIHESTAAADGHLTRIPLTIVATATLHETPDVLVGVMAVDLDRVEERLHAAEQALAGKAWSRRLMERAYR